MEILYPPNLGVTYDLVLASIRVNLCGVPSATWLRRPGTVRRIYGRPAAQRISIRAVNARKLTTTIIE